jgi:hypothetical protein
VQIDRRRVGRFLVGLLAAAGVLALAVASATASASTDPTVVGVSAVDAKGHALPFDPKLKPNEVVTIRATGFQVNHAVEIRTLSGIAWVVSDASGIATYPFTVPGDVSDGAHVIRLIGPPDLRGQPVADVGNVDVVVPRLANFLFRTGKQGGKPSPSQGVSGTTASHGGGGGPLAGTGWDVLAGLIAAGALVALGAFFVGTARRGRRV